MTLKTKRQSRLFWHTSISLFATQFPSSKHLPYSFPDKTKLTPVKRNSLIGEMTEHLRKSTPFQKSKTDHVKNAKTKYYKGEEIKTN